ncbi:hypothetical protein CGCSCA1_v007258 [Colletotrichum siamense]|nr:hypothetical protein CGCSCA1_v007258 [Colletotrichum siamense]
MTTPYSGFILSGFDTFYPASFVFADGIPKSPFSDAWTFGKPIPETMVTVGLGDGKKLSLADGNFPSVALWNEEGQRMGQYQGHYAGHVKQGGEKTVVIRQTMNGRKDEDPGYIMLSADNDAICIAMIQVSNSRHTSAFFGDTGYACGQSWYFSDRKMTHDLVNRLTSRCVWLDSDHSGTKNARAMSYHLKDMLPAKDKIALYNRDGHKYLCTTRRFAWWANLKPNGWIPFYKPPLDYYPDSEDKKKEGADIHPDLILDDKVYDKDIYLEQGESRKVKEYHKNNPFARTKKRRSKKSLRKRQGANMDLERIVVTEIPGQTATEICEHPNSVGYDIASYVDMKYCDISEKKLYDLCSGTITTNCFDGNSTTFIGVINARGEDSAPAKAYKTRSDWK